MPTITKTVASSGGDYATPALAAADFNAGTVPGASGGDDVVFNITENAAFDSTFLITANPTGYASYTLTADPSVRHDGTYGNGARLVLSTAVAAACSDAVAALNGTIEWLEITVTGSGKISAGYLLAAVFSSGKTKTIRNCMLHDNGAPTGAPFRACAIGGTATDACSFQTNTVIANCLISNWKSGSTIVAMGVGTPANASAVEVYNTTIDGVDVTGGTSGTARGLVTTNHVNKTVSNCVVTNVGANTTTGTRTCFAGNGGSTVGSNNASSDATAFGTDSLTSIVRGDNFNDADAGDFRPLNDSAPIFAAGSDLGTTPTGVNSDLTGRDRDAEGDAWSIGAYQLSAGGVVDPTVWLANPAAYDLTQESGGAATVNVSGSYAGGAGPTAIEVQVNGGAWATLDAAPAAGTYSGTVSVPAGTNTLAVRWANETDATASVSDVLVGTVYLGCGQSNESNRLTNQQSYTHATQKASVIDQDDLAWRELTAAPTDPEAAGGSYHALLATQHLADRDEPCGFVTTANGGQTIGEWFTTTAQASWTAAKGRVTASGTTPAAVLIDIGESDALGATGYDTYRARLLNWIADIQSTYPGAKVFVALTGTVGGAVVAAELDAIRQAQLSVIDPDSGVYLSRCGHDRASLHWTTDAEGLTQAARTYLAYQYGLFGGSNGRGPRVSSATLDAARTQITVAFDRPLKTGLTFDEEPWAVDDDGDAATVSSVAYHGSNTSAVVLTLSTALSGAGGTCSVTFCGGDTAAGRVIPKSADVAMPSGSAVQLPAEPFYGVAAAEFAGVARGGVAMRGRRRGFMRG